MQREVRFSTSQPIEHESAHPRQTSDSCLQRVLDLPLPEIHPNSLYDTLDIWSAASLNAFKIKVEQTVDSQPTKRVVESSVGEASSSNQAEWTPLMYAVYLGHIESTKYLLELNVNVEKRNLVGQTALMLAATCGNEHMIRLLLHYTIDSSACDRFGRTALHYAVQYGQNVLIEPLLAHGFDPNLPDTEGGMTPMLMACKSGQLSLVNDLLKHNGNPRLTNKLDQNGEMLAMAGEHDEVVKRLQWHNKLYELFEKEGLLKYLPLFEAHQITQRKFVQLTTQEINSMGIHLLGPQKKIESLASELRKRLSIGNNHRAPAENNQNRLRSGDTRLDANIKRTVSPATSPVNGTVRHGDPADKRLLSEYAYRVQLMTSQLSHQYSLNEKLVERLKEIREVVRHSGNDLNIRSMIQAIDESNVKILALIK